MAFKFLLLVTCMVKTTVGTSFTPIMYSASPVVTKILETDPQYSYSYDIQENESNKYQQENFDNNIFKNSYQLLEADEFNRIINKQSAEFAINSVPSLIATNYATPDVVKVPAPVTYIKYASAEPEFLHPIYNSQITTNMSKFTPTRYKRYKSHFRSKHPFQSYRPHSTPVYSKFVNKIVRHKIIPRKFYRYYH